MNAIKERLSESVRCHPHFNNYCLSMTAGFLSVVCFCLQMWSYDTLYKLVRFEQTDTLMLSMSWFWPTKVQTFQKRRLKFHSALGIFTH